MNIRDYIGETSDYDKKESIEERRPKSWCKSISAFANGNGGFLLFGISDDDEIIGLHNPEKDAEKISEIIKARITPIPEFNLSFVKEANGEVIIVLNVYKGDETPYYYSADNAMEAYIRVGNESVKATSTEMKRLVLRGKNSTYDSLVSSYEVEDYAYTKLRARYKKWTGNSFEDKDLVSFGLATEEGMLTNAGALIADDSPIKCSRLFCTRWNGLNKAGGTIDAIDDDEFEGSILYLLDEGEAFIRRHAGKMWRKLPNSREEMPEYVERSYHEALINALVHRDYLVSGSEVHIDIFDDRMEIYSPGGMADGLDIQDRDPLTVPSTRRNPVLADIFNRLGYMERKGSGFDKIISSYEFQVNFVEEKKPRFYSDRTQFRTIMPNLNYSDVPQGVGQGVGQDVGQDLASQIIEMITVDSKISKKKMAEKLNLSEKTIEREMKKMPNVKYVGSGYSGHWEIVE